MDRKPAGIVSRYTLRVEEIVKGYIYTRIIRGGCGLFYEPQPCLILRLLILLHPRAGAIKSELFKGCRGA